MKCDWCSGDLNTDTVKDMQLTGKTRGYSLEVAFVCPHCEQVFHTYVSLYNFYRDTTSKGNPDKKRNTTR